MLLLLFVFVVVDVVCMGVEVMATSKVWLQD